MKNYAIVLGVSEYKNANDLPGCANDASIMHDFLVATEKYEVFQIPGNVNKHVALDKISNFLSKRNEDEDIDEILFYFSGHGHQDEDMHFIMSDTDIDKINSTSLNNSEIDNIIKGYNPKVFVKIIDACQSGLTYIKDIDDNQEQAYILKSKGFENCIFFSSSKRTQSSYANEKYSEFTKAIIDAVNSIDATTIRYIDIQNYLADTFKNEGNGQTPYFNTQCEGTEIFCNKSEKVVSFLEAFYSMKSKAEEESTNTNADLVKQYLEMCRNEEQVRKLIDDIYIDLENKVPSKDWIKEFYVCSAGKIAEHVKYSYREDKRLLNVLSQKVKAENLYIKIYKEKIERDNHYGFLMSGYKWIPVEFTPLVHGLPELMCYSFKAKNEELPDYEIPLVFIYSPTSFYVFSTTKQFVKKGWDEYHECGETRYVYKQFRYSEFTKGSWNDFIKGIFNDAEDYIEKSLVDFVTL